MIGLDDWAVALDFDLAMAAVHQFETSSAVSALAEQNVQAALAYVLSLM